MPHLKRQAGIVVHEAHGQTVLLRLNDGSYYAIEEVGARVWELCDGQRSLDEIVVTLCGEFDAPPKTVEADVAEFVGDLRREGLLVEAA